MAELAQLTANGLISGSVLAMASIGLTLVYGLLRIVNFAHGDYMTLGAVFAYSLNVGAAIGIVPAALLGSLGVGLMAVGLEMVLWRPMRKRAPGVVSLMLTGVGLSFVMRQAIYFAWGPQSRHYAVDLYSTVTLGPIRLPTNEIPVIFIAAFGISVVAIFLATTRTGKAIRAYSDNRDLAAVAGVNVDMLSLLTWLIAGSLAGLAGVLLGLLETSINPELGGRFLLFSFAGVILGGIGSAYGALVGGLAIGLAAELSTWSALAGGLPGTYKPVVIFVLLILALIVRPNGILGAARLR